ncbi:MAG: hypothetical protein HXY22_12490 [Alphaproteobacteria bacterium]|nr:hypothetical protein [Alphaproteobacteria bacterium]
MLTAQDYKQLAAHLVARHGAVALTYADRAIAELEAQGEERRANSWRLLRGLVGDILVGRLAADRPLTLH